MTPTALKVHTNLRVPKGSQLRDPKSSWHFRRWTVSETLLIRMVVEFASDVAEVQNTPLDKTHLSRFCATETVKNVVLSTWLSRMLTLEDVSDMLTKDLNLQRPHPWWRTWARGCEAILRRCRSHGVATRFTSSGYEWRSGSHWRAEFRASNLSRKTPLSTLEQHSDARNLAK
jgi:hypothetical protein